MENYAKRIKRQVDNILKDIKAKGNYFDLYDFGNRIHGEAARRGLPHDRPVPFLPEHFDTRIRS